MRQTPAEQALGRLMQYLRLAGVEPSADVSASLLETVSEAVRGNEHALIGVVMDRFETRFELPSVDVPTPSPPVVRDSIGYDSE